MATSSGHATWPQDPGARGVRDTEPAGDWSLCRHFLRVSDGTRTRDRLDHNQELYLLSYAHHGAGRG